MTLQVKQTKKDKTWTALLIEESESSLKRRKATRERTFRRMYSSVFVLGGAVAAIYCCMFYLGSFVDVGKIIGMSQSDRAAKVQNAVKDMPVTKKRTLFSPIIENFSTNRIYMRKGQSILATYSLPNKTKLSLKIKQCKPMPLIEVFKCDVISERKAVVRNRNTGFTEFTVSDSGFYYFESQVVKAPSKILTPYIDYRVVWQRGSEKVTRTNSRPQFR